MLKPIKQWAAAFIITLIATAIVAQYIGYEKAVEMSGIDFIYRIPGVKIIPADEVLNPDAVIHLDDLLKEEKS